MHVRYVIMRNISFNLIQPPQTLRKRSFEMFVKLKCFFIERRCEFAIKLFQIMQFSHENKFAPLYLNIFNNPK